MEMNNRAQLEEIRQGLIIQIIYACRLRLFNGMWLTEQVVSKSYMCDEKCFKNLKIPFTTWWKSKEYDLLEK